MHIDQIELSASSLTSRHPLVLSVLSQTFLFLARGALPLELDVSRRYAQLLSVKGSPDVVEISDVQHGKPREEEELFWMCFGDLDEVGGDGSTAEHWRWRPTLNEDQVRVWKVDHAAESTPVSHLVSLSKMHHGF